MNMLFVFTFAQFTCMIFVLFHWFEVGETGLEKGDITCIRVPIRICDVMM